MENLIWIICQHTTASFLIDTLGMEWQGRDTYNTYNRRQNKIAHVESGMQQKWQLSKTWLCFKGC